MNDYISDAWKKYIKVSYSEALKTKASSIVSYLEKNKIVDHKKIDGTQLSSIKLDTATFVYLRNNEEYNWHSDSARVDISTNSLDIHYYRFWIRLSYLTEGNPLEIGNWNKKGQILGIGDYKIREPNNIIGRIFPKPGKVVIFPSMMVHRVANINNNTTNRWVMREFISNKNSLLNLSDIELKELYKKYFKDDNNWY